MLKANILVNFKIMVNFATTSVKQVSYKKPSLTPQTKTPSIHIEGIFLLHKLYRHINQYQPYSLLIYWGDYLALICYTSPTLSVKYPLITPSQIAW